MRQGGFHRTGRDGALSIYLPNTKRRRRQACLTRPEPGMRLPDLREPLSDLGDAKLLPAASQEDV